MTSRGDARGRTQVRGNVLLLVCPHCDRPLAYAGEAIQIDQFVFDIWPPTSVFVTRDRKLAIQGSTGGAWVKYGRGTRAEPWGTYSIKCRCGHGPFQFRSERIRAYWSDHVERGPDRVVRRALDRDL